ncbi:MAG: carboxylating nicotinate-nucleotide diphosphorylase [Actinomycetota bacterium]
MPTTAEDLAIVHRALEEDAPNGDLTSELVVPASARCSASLVIKETGVVAGTGVARAVFDVTAEQDGSEFEHEWLRRDGEAVTPGTVIATIGGSFRSVLRAERPAINLLAHLSGIATLTRRFVEAAAPAQVLCTRKTLPGLRSVERDAVVAGGGSLHRASLSDAILIKDNHLLAAAGVGEAVARAKTGGVPVEVEVETMDQLEDALAAGADRILLDNPTPALVRQAVERVGDPLRLEISGGVTLGSVGGLVAAGARIVSVGRLTHSAPSLDISLEVTDVDL